MERESSLIALKSDERKYIGSEGLPILLSG